MTFNLLILGAGRGARLSPITDRTPKPLILLQESDTIIIRLVKQFKKYLPISRIWTNVSTHPETFLRYLSGLGQEFRPKVLFEPNLLGAANTLFEFSKIDDGPVIVIHGDLVLSHEYVRSLIDEVTNRTQFLVFCHSRDSNHARSQIQIDDSNMVTALNNGISPSDSSNTVMVNSGVYFFPNLRTIGTAPALGSEIADSILQTLISNNRLYAIELPQQRISVDSFDQLEEARKLVKSEKLDQ